VDDLSNFEKEILPKKKDSGKKASSANGLKARKNTTPIKNGAALTATGAAPMAKRATPTPKHKKHSVFKALEPDFTGANCDPDFERQQCGHLSCQSGKCTHCRDDIDCHSPRHRCFGPNMAEECTGAKCACHHKRLFPLSSADVEAMVLGFFATALAASGGIGGGGLLVPLFILVEDFEADLASPLSSATITGGAIVGYALYCFRWHPLFPSVQRPLIDYETVLIILPSLLTGTMIGTIFDKILPLWFIMSMLFMLLGVSTYRTMQKGLQTLESESAEKEEFEKDEALMAPAEDDSCGACAEDADPEDEEEKITGTRFPVNTLVLIGVFWLFVFCVALLKGGGDKAPSILSFVECNNGPYWILQVFCWVVMAVLFIFVRDQVLHHGEGGLDGDIVWTPMNSLTLPMLCLPCGIFAGLLGVGGGMVVGPLLLEMGARHSTVAATSTFTVLVTASSSAMQFVLMGKLPIHYALTFSIIGGVGTFVGQLAVENIIARYKSTSVIVFGIAGVILGSTIAMGYTGIRSIVRVVEIDGNMGLRNLCL